MIMMMMMMIDQSRIF